MLIISNNQLPTQASQTPKNSGVSSPLPSKAAKPLTAAEIWRRDAATALWNAGYQDTASAFYYCGDKDKFLGYLVCRKDPRHFHQAVLEHCHLRFCNHCERRAQAKRMERFEPAIDAALKSWRAGSYRLRSIVLTTPYSLEDTDIRRLYAKARKAAVRTLERVCYEIRKTYATEDEHRRKRISLKRHGIGLIVGDELGEKGQKLHFHVLGFTPYLPVALLAEWWRHYTSGDAYITYVKGVANREAAFREVVTKYVTKLTEVPPRLVPQLHKMLEGRRRIRSYGIWYGIEPVEEQPCRCPKCNKIVTYMNRVLFEMTYGKKVLTNFSSNTGNKSGEKIVSMAQFVDGRAPPEPPPIPIQQLLTGLDDENLIPKRKDTTYSQ